MNIMSFSSFATNTSNWNYESLPAASQWVSCNSELHRLLAVTFGIAEAYPITNNNTRLSTTLIALEYSIWNSIERPTKSVWIVSSSVSCPNGRTVISNPRFYNNCTLHIWKQVTINDLKPNTMSGLRLIYMHGYRQALRVCHKLSALWREVSGSW